MKKTRSILLALVLALSLLAACGDSSSTTAASSGSASSGSSSGSAAPAEAGSWSPSANVEWYITSSPGGGSDIYTRKIIEIIQGNGWVTQTFLPTNLTDGGGEVGRMKVATASGGKTPDHTLLTFNSGDLMPMVQNTDNRVENFTPIAIMAVDKQLLFRGEHTPYQSFQEVLDAIASGTAVTIGGSKGDDIATYQALAAELGVSETQLPYITYDGTGDAITALLGGHVDLLISKPAAASEYVEAGSIQAVLALSTERYGGKLADAPTLSEVGDYNDVEVPVWRGVAAPGKMSPEAAAFWSDVLRQVSETEQWKTEYLDKNMLIGNYMDLATTQQYMADYQADYLASIGK